VRAERLQLGGGRAAVREQTVRLALRRLLEACA
jgi:nicotinamide mononucleotide (NMN) deamidase PncC